MRLDRKFINCVFPIGVDNDEGIQWVGTGLLYGKKIPGSEQNYVFLATNKHVVENKENLTVRLNTVVDGAPRDFDLGGTVAWELHGSDDVAVTIAPSQLIDAMNAGEIPLDWVREDETWNLGQLLDENVSEGDPAFVVGFPLGDVGDEMSAPIVRSASIARIQDTLAGYSQHFLIDSAVFPGNSGGPCLLAPVDDKGIFGVRFESPKVVGLVSAYVPYRDVAVSRQTGEVRVVFTEHSGLSHVVPFDRVEETIIQYATAHRLEVLLPNTEDFERQWDAKSFLSELGYSVRKGGPSKGKRTGILSDAVDSHGLQQVARHIAWLIRSFSSRPDANSYRQAIRKWQSDLDMLRIWYSERGEAFWWPSTN